MSRFIFLSSIFSLDLEEYRNPIVRLAEYSDYFINLGEKLQNEIIERTGHSNY